MRVRVKPFGLYIVLALALLVTAVWAFISLSRDTTWDIPATFQASDLVGTWLTQTAELTETVELRNDGTFTQIFTSTAIVGPTPLLYHGVWSVEHRASKCVYVRLKNMHYLRGTMSSIQSEILGTPSDYYSTLWDDCEERLISVENSMVLVVAHIDDIVLIRPSVDRDGSTQANFKRVAP